MSTSSIRGCSGRPARVTAARIATPPSSVAGVFTNASIEQPILDESDLLIGIGLDPVELIPRAWQYRQPIVYCGPWRVPDDHVPFELQVLIPIAETAAVLSAGLMKSHWDARRLGAQVEEQRRHVRARGDGFTAQRLVEAAASKLASSAGRVTVDAGAHMFPATVLWPVRESNGMLISNGLSTMGFALPAAIGAALLDRERPVVALTGDGGLLMCAGELLTAVREKVRVITIVFNDASLSLIEIKQQARQLPPSGVALGAVDWVALARSVGMPGWAARDEAELDYAIDAAIACNGPSLVEARIDRSNYGATLRAIRG